MKIERIRIPHLYVSNIWGLIGRTGIGLDVNVSSSDCDTCTLCGLLQKLD